MICSYTSAQSRIAHIAHTLVLLLSFVGSCKAACLEVSVQLVWKWKMHPFGAAETENGSRVSNYIYFILFFCNGKQTLANLCHPQLHPWLQLVKPNTVKCAVKPTSPCYDVPRQSKSLKSLTCHWRSHVAQRCRSAVFCEIIWGFAYKLWLITQTFASNSSLYITLSSKPNGVTEN